MFRCKLTVVLVVLATPTVVLFRFLLHTTDDDILLLVHGLQLQPQSSSSSSSSPLSVLASSSSSSAVTAAATSAVASATIVSTRKNGGHTLRYNILNDVSKEMLSDTMVLPTKQNTATISSTTSITIVSQWRDRIVNRIRKIFQREYWTSIMYEQIPSTIRSTFLPIGYPNTVPNHYMKYVIWSSLQDVCTNIRSVLATQRVLQGIGVGTNTATTLSAIQNFLLRDAAGMFASLSFTSITSGIFVKDIKRWRIFADIMVDIGITMEVIAVQLPKSYFVPMLCIGNMCKALCGVAAGATSGSIALYWSSKANSNNNNNNKQNNNAIECTDISDINAKFGAQNTVTGSIGLIVSALFARSVATAPLSIVYTLYTLLTIFHIYANMQCMRIIAFSSFNTVRYNYVISSFFNQWFTTSTPLQQQQGLENGSNDRNMSNAILDIPTPYQVAKSEPLFFINNIPSSKQRSIPIHFGVSYNEYTKKCNVIDIHQIQQALTNNNSQNILPYLISIGSSSLSTTSTITPTNCCIVVAVPSNTNAYHQAQAYFHATLYRYVIINQLNQLTSSKFTTTDNSNTISSSSFVDIVEQQVQRLFPILWTTFVTECTKAGWDLSRTELHSKGYELSYNSS